MQKTLLMDADAMRRATRRIAHEILEHTDGAGELILAGIRRRGVTVARQIAAALKDIAGVSVPVEVLDVTFYRDDLSKKSERPVVAGKPAFDPAGKNVILVDDVLFTGRTARAAMDAVMDAGRPSSVRLAVLVDRGHRELPIRADFVGKNIPTSLEQAVSVCVEEFDGEEGVFLIGN